MNSTNEIKTKKELSAGIWDHIKQILKERKISQVELQRLCLEYGYRISQPEISKLYSGKIQLTLYQLAAFAEILNLSTDYLISEKSAYHRFQVEGTSFITNPSNEAFRGYLGSYQTLFHSTASDETQLIRGQMHFTPSIRGEICEALFLIDTGVNVGLEHPHVKKYQGQLIISRKLNTAFCILANDDMGEIGMIEFRHRSFLVKQAECRLGLALTVTAGEKKIPAAHRIFLSRRELSGNEAEKIAPFLKLETEELLIKKAELTDCFEEKKSVVRNPEGILRYAIADEYVSVNEHLIRVWNRKMNRQDIAEFMGILNEISADGFACELSETDDSRAYDIYEKLSEEQGSGNLVKNS